MSRTALLTCAVAFAVAGCGSSGPSAEPVSASATTGTTPVVRPDEVTADHNAVDLDYLDRLTSQHRQAVDLVAMVANKDVSPGLRELARAIGRDRNDEIRTIRRMERAWGAPPHPPDFHGNPGELTMAELSELYRLDGSAFAEQWTQRMVDNHRGAVALSRIELGEGLNLETREFARGLVRRLESQVELLEAQSR